MLPAEGSCCGMVPEEGVEPSRAQGPLDFESSASTSFTTPARIILIFYYTFLEFYVSIDIDKGKGR